MSWIIKNVSGKVQTMPKTLAGRTNSESIDNWAIGQIDVVTDDVLGLYNNHADVFTILARSDYAPEGDDGIRSNDDSPFRRGTWGLKASGALYTLLSDFAMHYWTHNVALDADGNFLGRDDAGTCTLWVFTESGMIKQYNAITAAVGVVPVWTLVWFQDTSTGFGLGNIVGTSTNDNAPVGNVGEYIEALSDNRTSVVTFTNGQATIGWVAHGLKAGTVVQFTNAGGGLPVHFAINTSYFVSPTNLTAGTFEVSLTVGGASIVAGSAGTGVQTGINSAPMTSTVIHNVCSLTLTAGDWDLRSTAGFHGRIGGAVTPVDIKLGPSLSPSAFGPFGSYSYDYLDVPITDDPVHTSAVSRFSLAATTTLYLVMLSDFAGGAMDGYGFMRARRIR